jgi:hypothetical protein
MIRCARCRRVITNSVVVSGSAYGATCALIITGAKPKRQRAAAKADERQLALITEAV